MTAHLDVSFGGLVQGDRAAWAWLAFENVNDRVKGAGQGVLAEPASLGVADLSALVFALRWLAGLPPLKSRTRTACFYGPRELCEALAHARALASAAAGADLRADRGLAAVQKAVDECGARGWRVRFEPGCESDARLCADAAARELAKRGAKPAPGAV
jgi:hypothetical protein